MGPAAVEAAAQQRHVLDVVAADAVHDRFGVAFEEGHERLDLRDGLALLGAGHGLHDVGAALVVAGAAGGLVAGGVQGPAHGAAELRGRGLVGLGGVEEGADEVVEVVAHPRHRGELHEVGGLVDGDPQPELAGGQAQAPLDLDDVGGDEQEAPGVGGEGLELAEDARGQEREDGSGLDAGDLRGGAGLAFGVGVGLDGAEVDEEAAQS